MGVAGERALRSSRASTHGTGLTSSRLAARGTKMRQINVRAADPCSAPKYETRRMISVVGGWPMGDGVDDLAVYAKAQGAEGYDVVVGSGVDPSVHASPPSNMHPDQPRLADTVRSSSLCGCARPAANPDVRG